MTNLDIKQSYKKNSLLSILNSAQDQLQQKLLICCDKGQWRGVYAILHQGIAVDDCVGLNSYSPLHYSCKNGHLEVTRILLQTSCQIDRKNTDGETALHLTALSGNLNLVELLLDRGANINSLTNNKETALFYAVRMKDRRMIIFLLKKGINSEQKNRYGDTAKDETQDETIHECFNTTKMQPKDNISLRQEDLLNIAKFLDAFSLVRASRICSRWHRITQTSELWNSLGVQRHEMVFQASVGLGFIAPMLGFRIKTGNSKSRPSTCSNNNVIFPSFFNHNEDSILSNKKTGNGLKSSLLRTQRRPATAALSSYR